jgi:DNA-binding transcriptional ArsR family regulator
LLGDLDIDPLLERLVNPVTFARPPGLEAEPDDEREVILKRLSRLAAEKRLRTRYVALLRDIWAHFDSTWVTAGREHVQAVGATWATRFASGMPALDLCHGEHIARRTPAFHLTVRRAQDDGTLLVSPCLVGRGHIIALPGRLSLAIGVGDVDPVVTRREAAAEISDRLKALADPTRLTILTQLAYAPSGVTELARTLHIAQPTASVHLRQLREAGLVTAQRAGTRMVYSVRPDAVDQLLTQVSHQLTRSLSPAA